VFEPWKEDIVMAMVMQSSFLSTLVHLLHTHAHCQSESGKSGKSESGGRSVSKSRQILPKLLDIFWALVGHHPRICKLLISNTSQFIPALFSLIKTPPLSSSSSFVGGVGIAMKMRLQCQVLDIISVMCRVSRDVVGYLHRNDYLRDIENITCGVWSCSLSSMSTPF